VCTLKTQDKCCAGPSFADILKPEIVLPLLDSRTLKERLVPFLPEVSGTVLGTPLPCLSSTVDLP
jgi:hypothetical protein